MGDGSKNGAYMLGSGIGRLGSVVLWEHADEEEEKESRTSTESEAEWQPSWLPKRPHQESPAPSSAHQKRGTIMGAKKEGKKGRHGERKSLNHHQKVQQLGYRPGISHQVRLRPPQQQQLQKR